MHPGASQAGGRTICVFGNLTIDLILSGVSALPGWGQETLAGSRLDTVAGQAAYVATAAVRLGLDARVISTVGDDEEGGRIRAALEGASIDVEAVETVPDGATSLTIAMVRPDGERAFVSHLGCLDRCDSRLLRRHWKRARSASVLAMVGLFNLPRIDLTEAAKLLGRARRAGVLTLVDTGWDPGGWAPATVESVRGLLAETDVFLPNLDEATALTGESDPLKALVALDRSCAGIVVIKAGPGGSWTLGPTGPVHVEAIPTAVANAVGAGDVFDAGFLAGYLSTRDLTAGMVLGTGAASWYVSRESDRFPTRLEAEARASRAVIQTGDGR